MAIFICVDVIIRTNARYQLQLHAQDIQPDIQHYCYVTSLDLQEWVNMLHLLQQMLQKNEISVTFFKHCSACNQGHYRLWPVGLLG